MIKFLKTKNKQIKLRERLFLSLTLITVFSVLLISILFYIRSSAILTHNTKRMTEQTMMQTSDYISFRLTTSKDISSTAYLDAELKTMINAFKNETNQQAKFDRYRRLTDMVTNLGVGRDVHHISLYVDDPSIETLSRSTIKAEALIKNESWYQDVIDEKGGIVWLPEEKQQPFYPYKKRNVISIVRTIPNQNVNDPHIAVLVVDIAITTFNDIINQTPITKDGTVYLVDQDGYVVTSTEQEAIATNLNLDEYINIDHNSYIKGNSERHINNQKSIVFHQRITDMDWRLISIVPHKEINESATDVLRFMAGVLAIVLLMISYISHRLSKNITYRLEDLSSKMDMVKEGEWDLSFDNIYQDEIGELQDNFLYMTLQINQLMEDKYQAAINLRKAELRTLQAQINPHFLYNILDLINWLAIKHGASDIQEIVEKLAKFFRLSLSSGKEFVKIKDEIEHIKLYTEIQNKRFDDNIALILDVEEEILDYYTINLILQPLIENSILHGINEKTDKKGTIKITAYQDIESIVIEIEDDGIGMSEAKLNSILNKEKVDGFGVHNVNERLTIRFGETYGLFYDSIHSGGTRVTMRIPIISTLDELD
ncbi:sensor histidine kinase [Erysipelothrix urinaevulpis]|uniref:sensor histidine kinase n=1 Tax=Erysipelothrix urinaevulpis TaxID=2683717 RepID=UPI00135B6070|nr:sensor histidine kinase [Erysipelothrix urinaevulpis]